MGKLLLAGYAEDDASDINHLEKEEVEEVIVPYVYPNFLFSGRLRVEEKSFLV